MRLMQFIIKPIITVDEKIIMVEIRAEILEAEVEGGGVVDNLVSALKNKLQEASKQACKHLWSITLLS